jgi:hypothetical protein
MAETMGELVTMLDADRVAISRVIARVDAYTETAGAVHVEAGVCAGFDNAEAASNATLTRMDLDAAIEAMRKALAALGAVRRRSVVLSDAVSEHEQERNAQRRRLGV